MCGILRLQCFKCGGDFRPRLFVEAGQAQIAVVADHLARDGLHLNDFAGQLDHEGINLVAGDGEVNRGADGAAHLLHRIVQRLADDGLAVDGDDVVPGLDVGAGGGRAVHGGDDLHRAFVSADLDAEPAVVAAGLVAHLVEGGGIEITGVRIERGEHPVDGRLDQLLVVHRHHILLTHVGQHIAEQLQRLVGVGSGLAELLVRIGGGAQGDRAAEREGGNADQK